MSIQILSDFCRRHGSVDNCLPRLVAFAGLAMLGLSAATLYGGYLLGQQHSEQNHVDAATAEMQDLLAEERQLISDARAEQRAHFDALALKVAELQAHLMRLDALGERLVDVGKLDADEFDFATPPPMGGIDESLPAERRNLAELSVDMERIAGLLADREQKLGLLEQVLMKREIKAEVTPSGKPVKTGWMSSGFGKRTDPFNGKKSYHRGIDFAGKRGADVVAVASGVVMRSKRVAGYGNVVEIKHADGYSTLYGHNKENLVREGEMVSKGQTIALLGSTGRSSGPHVHFEVHRNGKIIDPLRFIRSH